MSGLHLLGFCRRSEVVAHFGLPGRLTLHPGRQTTAIHRTSAGGLRHPDVDGSRCTSGTPAAQRMSRTVSAGRPPHSPRELSVMCPGHYGCLHGNGNAGTL
eukprot:scaffold13010_cov41-Phaeocystis_antarctica.AAC.1